MNGNTMNFKQILLYEKSIMHPLNRLMAYTLTPIYALFSALIVIAFVVLMEIDDEKYFVVGISLLCIFAIVSVLFLLTLPFVRKKVIADELNSYDFDRSALESALEYDYSTDDIAITFDKDGMRINGDFFDYDHLDIFLITENYCHRILIALCFALDENYIQIKLDAKVLKMISDFQIYIQNEDVLEYILHNKEDAFRQIYNKGYVSLQTK